MSSWARDVKVAWGMLLLSTAIAFVCSYLFVFLLRYIGGTIIWGSFVIALIGTIGGGFYSYYLGAKWTEEEPESGSGEYMQYFAYACWIIGGIVLLTLLCCYSAIKVGLQVFQACINFVKDVPTIFAQPPIVVLVGTAWWAVWLVSFLWLFSVGEPGPRKEYPQLTEIQWSEQTRYLVIYQVFMFFWMNAFIIGCAQMVIAAAACIWFFTSKMETRNTQPVMTAIKWTIFYHMGSVAFGSLIIAICKMIQLAFEYLRR